MAFDICGPLPYSAVNRAVNDVIFDGRFRLAPVYLDIEGEIAKDIASRLGLPEQECLEAIAQSVSATLKWQHNDPFSWHLSELKTWNELERQEPPPFSALLTVLSLAAERMHEDEEYSAQNYYERLFEVLGVTDESRKNSLKQHARSMLPFWKALNQWLAEQDFEFGRPTAQQINAWPYVSYALSQALVRDGDRKRIHSLFSDYGLAPHEQLTSAEMALYLHEWMGGSGPSAWLKKIWATPDLRPRVTAAACSELEAWEGAAESDEKVQRRRLSWAAALQEFPLPRLRLFLSASEDQDEDRGSYPQLRLCGTVSPAAKAAFASCPEGVYLTPSTSGGLAVVEPVAKLSLSPLMLASFELEEAATGLRFQRAARAIVPLVKLDTGPFYREVSRISFLRPHLVLCHVQWRERVERLLKLNARSGFRVRSQAQLPGLAEDWVLISEVELLRAPVAVNADLQALVPLSEGVSVEALGGLRLSQGIWHSKAPPEITVASQRPPLRLELKDAAGEVHARAAAKATSCRLVLPPDLNLEARDFTLAVFEADRQKSETGFSFRSASHPRRLVPGSDAGYTLSKSNPASLLTACLAPEGELILRGLGLQGNFERLQVSDHGGQGVELPSAEEEAPPAADDSYRLNVVGGLAETCVLRGHHYWICQEFRAGEDRSDDRWMTCSTCANRVLTRNRGAPPKRRHGPYQKGHAPSPAAEGPKMPPRQVSALDAAVLFDALCYLGSGTWRKFQDLAGTGDQPALAVQRLLLDLFALGHLDLIYDTRLRSVASWTVAPPTLVPAAGGVYAAGFRSSALLDDLDQRLTAIGGKLEVKPLENAPPRYLWKGVSAAEAEAALGGLVDPHGRPLKVSPEPALAIAASAPAISQLASILPALRLETPEDLQRFDAGKGVWRSANDTSQEGAYRGGYGGRRYFFAAATGEQVEGPYSVVKILAAKAAGLKLHSYSRATQEFQAVLGCEPPGLFHRALASCSGEPPARTSGRLFYSNVPADVAATIITKIYG